MSVTFTIDSVPMPEDVVTVEWAERQVLDTAHDLSLIYSAVTICRVQFGEVVLPADFAILMSYADGARHAILLPTPLNDGTMSLYQATWHRVSARFEDLNVYNVSFEARGIIL